MIKRILNYFENKKKEKEKREHMFALLEYCSNHDCNNCGFADKKNYNLCKLFNHLDNL